MDGKRPANFSSFHKLHHQLLLFFPIALTSDGSQTSQWQLPPCIEYSARSGWRNIVCNCSLHLRWPRIGEKNTRQKSRPVYTLTLIGSERALLADDKSKRLTLKAWLQLGSARLTMLLRPSILFYAKWRALYRVEWISSFADSIPIPTGGAFRLHLVGACSLI